MADIMKEKLHIIFLAGWYPSRVFPYNGDFIQRHAEAVSLLHKVTIIHVVTDRNNAKSIEIIDNKINGIRTLIAYVKPSFFKPMLFSIAFTKLFRLAGKFDLIHANILFPVGTVACFYKWFHNKKYLITEHHTIYQPIYKGKIGWLRKILSPIIARNASVISPVTIHLANDMRSNGLKCKYVEVPNVVDTELFTAKNLHNNEVFSLIHVSNMEPRKRVNDILDVIGQLQSSIKMFEFYLIGENSDQYRSYAQKIGIREGIVEYIDQISHQELAEYYKRSHVFLLFSDSENLPCVILESFSCGTPVVSKNVGGISEYFPSDFGFLVNDITGFKECILKIYNGHKTASPRSMHDYVVRHFSPLEIARSFSKLYYEIDIKK